MPFRVNASEEREVGDNALYFPDAGRVPRLESIANSEKQLRIMSLKRKKNLFFAECYYYTFNFILMRLATSIYDPESEIKAIAR
jgi:hypothetical protein